MDEQEQEVQDGIHHTMRTMDGGTTKIRLTRGTAIKIFCTQCLGWEGHPKKDCTSPMCPLFPYRGRSLATHHGDKQ